MTSPIGASTGTSTAHAVSPDSGRHWTAEGAWQVAPGVHRIPLPLPMDGLRAINVYVVEADDGLVLVDGGWAIPEARELLDTSLRGIGSGFGDIRRFLVTHVHRDHYTMARVLGTELGVDVTLGADERPALDLLLDAESLTENPFHSVLRTAGAAEVAAEWQRLEGDDGDLPDRAMWSHPDTWLTGDRRIDLGPRVLDAVHTPGHTAGHYVYADTAERLLFAGDHVLPTITPSIGFVVPVIEQPLGQFLASLAKVRALPDCRVLPAHGPVSDSAHARVDELTVHHERRLDLCLAALRAGARTAHDAAGHLGWTRHEHAYDTLDWFSRGMAAMETKAHLDLLVARGQACVDPDADGDRYAVL